MEEPNIEHLFSYGTLRQEEVQLSIFGRRLAGHADVLPGCRLTMIESEDEVFNQASGASRHRNLQFTGNELDAVEGRVFAITKEELERADKYEPFDYRRVEVKLKSGIAAWIYLKQLERPS